MKMKQSVCFILKKDFASVELNILITLKYFGIFHFVQSLMFDVGLPVQNKMKFENLRS